MTETDLTYWNEFLKWALGPTAGISLDASRAGLGQRVDEHHWSLLRGARKELADLEAGAVSNVDEQRMVGHYWLRAPSLAPTTEISRAIEQSVIENEQLIDQILTGSIRSSSGKKFSHLYVLGIGGSALGPQLLRSVFGAKAGQISFIDNIDAEGIERSIAQAGAALDESLFLVISKSGGTKETACAEELFKALLAENGLDFSRQAVSITQLGSALYQRSQDWLARLPLWDWVGGRTSIWSSVGLFPLLFMQAEARNFLKGAADFDAACRNLDVEKDPAVILALSWLVSGEAGRHNFVVLPYSDHLELLSRYLQQLIMESVGKGQTRSGKPCLEGISVFGNKGSTDQHAFVQQLRDGRNDFLACFIEVRAAANSSTQNFDRVLRDGLRCSDYLAGFLAGTREALQQAGRHSVTISLDSVTEHSLGALLALFERAVSLYAAARDINAYHQPGVEAGKTAAATFVQLQQDIEEFLRAQEKPFSVLEIARCLDNVARAPDIFHILERLVVRGVIRRSAGTNMETSSYLIGATVRD
jgi:glucose-6-phosphate isomerase